MKTLRQWLTENNVSVQAFAKLIGVPHPTGVYRWLREPGSKNAFVPQRRFLTRIAEVTNGEVTLDSFIRRPAQQEAA